MERIYLLLGGNLGDRESNLEMATEQISLLIGTISARSSVYETEPWGFEHEAPFLNQLVIAGTTLSPQEVMGIILRIEEKLGRVRDAKHFAARTIDIDILFYGDLVLTTDNLIIPHPKIHKRRFALEPLAEVEPGLVHPLFNKTISQLMLECNDKMKVARTGDKLSGR